MSTESNAGELTVVLESAAAVEVYIAESMQLGTGWGSGSILYGARHVGSAETVGGGVGVAEGGVGERRASSQLQGGVRKV
jgi:hypothetical protein